MRYAKKPALVAGFLFPQLRGIHSHGRIPRMSAYG